MNAIYHNLIADKAWLYVLEGLGTTLYISFFGLMLGTVIGAILCAAKMAKLALFRGLANFVIAVMRGSPVLLILMVLYYVVFANTRIDATLVAVMAFGLNSGAHIGEIMFSALSGVDKMQVEAARMLGFSKLKAFYLITLPQAFRIARPVYQNAIVNLIQWTSVVGYVAITDLTRTVNSIGSRTGDPFFALFLGIVLYLSISYLVFGIFKLSERWENKQ